MQQKIKSLAIDSRNKQEQIECIFANAPYLICAPFAGAVQPDFLQAVRDLGAPAGRFENDLAQYHLAGAAGAGSAKPSLVQRWFGGAPRREKAKASFDKADWNKDVTDGWDGSKVGGRAAQRSMPTPAARQDYYAALALYQKVAGAGVDVVRTKAEFEAITAAMGLGEKELAQIRKKTDAFNEKAVQRNFSMTDPAQKQALAFRLAQLFHAKYDGTGAVPFAQDGIAQWYDFLGYQGGYGADLFAEYSERYAEIILDQHHFFAVAFQLMTHIQANNPTLDFPQSKRTNVECGKLHSYNCQKQVFGQPMGREWFEKDPYLTDKPWLYQSAAALVLAVGALSKDQAVQGAILRELEADGCDGTTIAQLTTLAGCLVKEVVY